jgi:phosphoglucosamine mutase
MSERLFGTDGVRGKAGIPPLDPETVARIGAALVRVSGRGSAMRILVGRDTRESGAWLERALARGAHAEGAALLSLGVIPTPAVAYITRAEGFDVGIVISASHNPYEDNGIKVFSGRGEKYGEQLEDEIERIVRDLAWSVPRGVRETVEKVNLAASYVAHVRQILPDAGRLRGRRIAVDCANGATLMLGPQVLREAGLDVRVLNAAPDGRNINLGCGSTHPEGLIEAVTTGGFDLGIAFDGDGDRALFVDHRGRLVNGDAVMLMCAKRLRANGGLAGGAIVATVMSNIGLELALREEGIELVRCPVGDKYVMEEMLKRGLPLGGEQSGHIIFSEHLYTGDGIATALQVLKTMEETGRRLADLGDELTSYPQVLLNVRVEKRRDLRDVPAVAEVMDRVERSLAGQGRLLVRYSGTEPLLRVMIEGRNEAEIRAWAQEIVDVAKANL